MESLRENTGFTVLYIFNISRKRLRESNQKQRYRVSAVEERTNIN